MLGLNGSGKSSLLRIIAGVDKDYIGEVHFSPGYSIGMLEQEPQMDENKTVIEVVREGVKQFTDILAEFEEVNNKFSDEEILNDPDKMDKLISRQAQLQDLIDQHDLWNSNAHFHITFWCRSFHQLFFE